MANTDTTAPATETVKKSGRPATQVTAALVDEAKVEQFNLTRRALGLESTGDAIRRAVDEFIDAHADRTAKFVEFFADES